MTTDIDITKKGKAHAAMADGLVVDIHNPKAIGDAIEKLIDMLDALSPDPATTPACFPCASRNA
ncbi:hypothetical protein FJV76_19185 [Mesorhizobium sp. WSM4303]|uniref:hypothetical protein n=1 Tax=unclassified Mesorhizobium TaxID=325217 RepID=UPI00115F40E8|nr:MULTISPECIES: hypothetical protein [unclassified Mesorhizobium]TRC93112.1 hypothetical protein FJV77_23095 [Mesorhizobium sp. WSM4306]TRD02368.1 hypothetical protein FJV76_19185 [Mesorhizobium sp. WSM4303]